MKDKNIFTFELMINNDNFIVRDHRVHTVRILPGVTFLDMTYRLGRKAFKDYDFKLRNIVFTKPIATDEQTNRKVRVRFNVESEQLTRVEVKSQPSYVGRGEGADEEWSEHMYAELIPQSLTESNKTSRLSIDRFIESDNTTWDMDAIYANARKSDIVHRDFMKTLGMVYSHNNEELMELALGDLAEQYHDRFYLHPAFLDGATFAGASSYMDAASTASEFDNTPYIPFSIEEFCAYDTLPSTIYVYSKPAEHAQTRSSPDITFIDIIIYDGNGRCLATFKKLCSKRIRNAGLIKKLSSFQKEAVIDNNHHKIDVAADFTQNNVIENNLVKSDSLARTTNQEKSAVIKDIEDKMAALLKTKPKAWDSHAVFYELGMDSTQLLSLTKLLEKQLGASLYPTLLFEYSTIDELCDYLLTTDYPKTLIVESSHRLSDTAQSRPVRVADVDVSPKVSIENDLESKIHRILGQAANVLDRFAVFYELGLDSTQLLSLTKSLEKQLGQSLYPTLLFEYSTIDELSDYLLTQHYDQTLNSDVSKTVNEHESTTTQTHEIKYYTPAWQPQSLMANPKNTGRFLVVTDSYSAFNNVCKQAGANVNLTWVHPDAVMDAQCDNVDAVIFLHALNNTVADNNINQSVLDATVQPVFQLLQKNFRIKTTRQLNYLYVYSEQHSAHHCLHDAVKNLGPTVSLENPRFNVKTISLGQGFNTGAELWDVLCQELAFNQSTAVRYQGAQRYVQLLTDVSATIAPKQYSEHNTIKQRGVYIIIGGFGGVGRQLTEQLIKHYDTRIVLVGRSPIADNKIEFIEQYNTGTQKQVHYIQADITDLGASEELVRHVKHLFNEITGVIHAGGTLDDSLLPNKDLTSIERVLAPKVIGTLNLDRALRDEPIDHFIMFSSTTAVFGNAGQADYAYANGFMDSFAAYRKQRVSEGTAHGQTIAINWPYWQQGGMQVSRAIEDTFEQVGLKPLAISIGWEMFLAAINQSSNSQLIPLHILPSKIESLINGPSTEPNATRVTESARSQKPTAKPDHRDKKSVAMNNDDIAIIGLSGRYPEADNLDDFWANLKAGRDCISEVPAERWSHDDYFDPEKNKEGKTYSKWGGFVNDIDKFDASFFKATPQQAQMMDPQARLFLEESWRVIEDAGYCASALKNQSVGVFVGVFWAQYQLYGAMYDNANQAPLPESFGSNVANWTSYFFGLQGPSLAVDTQCSSSLTAIHLACDSLRKGESEVAIAGGVSLSVHPYKYVWLSQAKLLSTDGRCRSFGADGDGYVPGEGVGCALLKPLAKAIADGDHIYGVIKGSAINHGGKTSGFSVPSPAGQSKAIAQALQAANIDTRAIGYIETHGTGTSLGDSIEITGLSRALNADHHHNYKIGSVKSNIGHLESASGIAALSKVLLQMQHQSIVPSLHFENPNPAIDFKQAGFEVNQTLTPWPSPSFEGNTHARVAGISTFGASGSNAHLIVEEFNEIKAAPSRFAEVYLVPLSAKTQESLQQSASRLFQYLKDSEKRIDSLLLSRIAYTLQTGREPMQERIGFIVQSNDELLEKLRHYISTPNDYLPDGNAKNTALNTRKKQTQTHVDALFTENNYSELLALWCAGAEIDWMPLYGEQKPQRISLPTYVFKKERHWFSCEPAAIKKQAVPVGHRDVPAPLNADENLLEKEHGNDAVTMDYDFFYKTQSRYEGELWIDDEEKICFLLRYLIAEKSKTSLDSFQLDQGFFEMGLSSAQLVGVVSSLKKITRIELSPSIMFEYSTIEALAGYLIDNHKAALAKLAVVEKQRKATDEVYATPKMSQTKETNNIVPIKAKETPQKYPVSEGQKGLWALQKMYPQMSAYNIPLCLHGRSLDIGKFQETCNVIVEQYPLLRSIIQEDQGVVFNNIQPFGSCAIEKIDVSDKHLSDAIPLLEQKAKEAFDIDQEPLFRVHLFALAKQEFVVLLTIHHIVFDGISSTVLLDNIIKIYDALVAGENSIRNNELNTYADFVAKEQALLQSKEGALRLDYWKKQFEKTVPPLNLPIDQSKKSLKNHFVGEIFTKDIPSDISEEVKACCKHHRIYHSALFMSVFKMVLHQYTGQQDLVVGMPVNEREQGFDNTIGFLINMLPVRSELNDDMRFLHYAQSVQSTILDGIANSYPFSSLIKHLDLTIESGSTPLFNVAFEYQNFLSEVDDEKDSTFKVLGDLRQEGEYEIVLEVYEYEGRFSAFWKYNPEVFNASTIERMAAHYEQLLQLVMAKPQALLAECFTLMDKKIEHTLLEFNDTASDYPSADLMHELFSRKAQQQPTAVALVFNGHSLTYQELDDKSTILAKYLQQQGVGPDDLLAIFVERSPNMLIGLLGILKAGAAYIPLDPEYPDDRLQYILDDSQASIVVTQSSLQNKVTAFTRGENTLTTLYLDKQWSLIEETAESVAHVASLAGPRNLAYVIYTSGSTGNPKGVMIEHRSLVNFLISMGEEPGLSHSDRLLAVTTYSFDIAGLEMYLPLIKGAQCYLCDSDIARNADKLKQYIQHIKPTIMQATPTTWLMLFHSGWKNEERATLLCGGEALPESLKEYFINSHSTAWNLYGPTETTIWSTVEKISHNSIGIGKPIANTQIYLLDKNDRLAPIGVEGELCIGGDGLARGYLHLPELTAEKFIENPFKTGTALYRTGDLARRLENGDLEYIGRIDNQVKIRGFRIELGEIESQLNQHESIQTSVAVVRQQAGNKQLIAYFVHEDNRPLPDKALLSQFLASKIADYMMPEYFIAIDAIPLTPNGKIDRKNLAERTITMHSTAQKNVSQAELATKVATLWQDILMVEGIGLDDGFFKIGGNSLSAVILAGRISDMFSIEFTVTHLFGHPTIRKMSDYIRQKEQPHSPANAATQPFVSDIPINASLTGSADDYEDSLAIIGISCHLPDAEDHRLFWDNLTEGKESTQFLSEEQLREANVPEALINNPHYVAAKNTIEGTEFFDPYFFSLSPKNAMLMDPQFRTLLMHSWQAVEDAGYVSKDIPETSVFMSVSNNYYSSILQNAQTIDESNEYVAWLLSQTGTIPTMISYELGLKGPSLAVHSNCSSTLAGLSLAHQSLQSGESKYALVGASTLFPQKEMGYIYQPGLNFSSDGHCKAFDASADGMTIGEGVGALLLKKASDAIADNDNIYALIRGVALNNDGSDKAGFYAPSNAGQTAVIQKTLTASNIDPKTIQYVEAHGTGTQLGDPIEVSALTDVYRQYTNEKQFCGLGSVKSNIGHLDTAAGLAGCIKVALSLKHQILPPTINYTKENTALSIDDSPFYIVDELKPWPQSSTPRRAALSSFGIGGTNAHAILEEYVGAGKTPSAEINIPSIVPLSAKGKDRLFDYVEKLFHFLKTAKDRQEVISLRDLSYTLQVGREVMAHRIAFVVDSVDQLMQQLACFIEQKDDTSKTKSNDYFQNSLDNKHHFLSQDEDVQGLLKTWFEKGKLKPLAEFWAQNGCVDWRLLYTHHNVPSRMSLPTYPFAKDVYRVAKSDVVEKSLETHAVPVVNDEEYETLLVNQKWEAQINDTAHHTITYARQHVYLIGFDKATDNDRALAFSDKENITHLHFEGPINVQYNELARFLLKEVQAILHAKLKGDTLLQLVVCDDNSESIFSGLSGFLKTVCLENPKIMGQIITVDNNTQSIELVQRVMSDAQVPHDECIRYQNTHRLVKTSAFMTNTLSRDISPWKEGGVYWITGGFGGLGLLFAQEIVNKLSHATVLLTGRSELHHTQQQTLDRLSRSGVTVAYHRVDVTDSQAVAQWVPTILDQFGGLHGIIHAAGIIQDNFLLNKTDHEFNTVLAPKVSGLVCIDHVTQHIDLDFLVLFSSISSAWGTVGQSDYAAANGFMDDFSFYRNQLVAEGRRRGKTLSINWSLWKDGGMSVDIATEKVIEDAGMVVMDTHHGMQAFYQALASGENQVVVMRGLKEKMTHMLKKPSLNAHEAENRFLDDKEKDNVNTDGLTEKVAIELATLLGDIVGLSVDKIDTDDPLENYGIDSIVITQINRKLENIFGRISKTLLFEYQTLAALTDYFIDEYTDICMRWVNMGKPEASSNHKESSKESNVDVKINTVKKNSVSTSFKTKHTPQSIHREPIAIIGVSGSYPKAKTLEDYWDNLKSGKDCITEIPADRWSMDNFFETRMDEAINKGASYSKWGGFLDDFCDFDPYFFNLSPVEAWNIDPQERLFLQTCWQAIEDAGYNKEKLNRLVDNEVGVFAGITKTGFILLNDKTTEDGEPVYPYTSFSSLVNRVSYFFNFNGPSVPIDTMCSSSLVAVHEACENLLRGECKMAIAGGVNLYLHPNNYLDLCAQQMLSSDGQCKSFGINGNGFVPGEGVGAVVLKTLSAAEADGDPIYGLINGTATNHGGKTNGYTVPNPLAQAAVVRKALDKAQIDARSVSYIEAHGTGTSLGDPIEITGLNKAFKQDSEAKQFCAIGSVKSNIGHLEAAAGIAALTKVLLQLKHKKLTPSLHAEETNPNIDFETSAFVLNREYKDWLAPVIDGDLQPRIAGISSFGAGGSNAHIVVQEYAPENALLAAGKVIPVIMMSAKNTHQLLEKAKQLIDACEHSTIKFSDLIYTLQSGREDMKERIAFVAMTISEVKEKLERWVKGDLGKDIYIGSVRKNKKIKDHFASKQEFLDFITESRKNNRYSEVVKYWIEGLSYDWHAIYEGEIFNITRLPEYPFEKNRYWFYSKNQFKKHSLISETSPNKKAMDVKKIDDEDDMMGAFEDLISPMLKDTESIDDKYNDLLESIFE